VIAQARVRAEPALDPPQQRHDFFPVPALEIVRDVIPRQHNEIHVEAIDPLDTATQVRAADRAATVKIADVGDPRPAQAPRQAPQVQIDVADLDPFGPDPAGVDGPARAETQRSQRSALEMVPSPGSPPAN